MISKFSLVDIMQSFNTPKHYYRTLSGVEFDVESGDYNYTRRKSYIFRVTNGDTKCLLKFYKDYSLDKVKIDCQTIRLASEMGDSPFSKAQWLKDEFCFTYNNRKELIDVAKYDIDICESFELFLLSAHASDNKRVVIQKYASFVNVLRWLTSSSYVVDGLSLDSFYIDYNHDVKINAFDVDINNGCGEAEYEEFYARVVHVLKMSLQMLLSNNIGQGLTELLTLPEHITKVDLLKLLEKVADLDFINANTDNGVMEFCFNNPKYVVTDDRDENRITVINAKTGLKGFANYEGLLVTNCIYEELLNYVEGYAVAKLNGKSGVIDKNNHIVLDFVWDWVDFENDYNLFVVEKDGFKVILNRKLEQISNKKFKFVETFVDGYSIVLAEGGKSGVINTLCEYVISPIYDEIRYCQLKEFEVVLNETKEIINL
ncbi:MAG: WG repeat-containing protein [Rikenellaceae bacterium]